LKGPGSFTGLRIGFSTAKGLALSLGIPFASIPTLDCMAFSASVWPGFVLPLIDARQNNFFTALYCGGRRLSDVMDAGILFIAHMASGALSKASPGEKRLLLTGPDAGIFYTALTKNHALESDHASSPLVNVTRLDPQCRKGRAKEMLEIAKNVDIFNNKGGNFFSGPEYIRKSDAELHSNSIGQC
jgi:tRNA threonylcarbamoyladenosine biosynthesis protein TsaB